MVLLASRPAGAIVPSNDVVSGATPIADITFPGAFEFQNTSEATTDSVDSALNASCGAEATEASVWFKVIAPSDAGITINASLSFYSARVIVAKGEPDAVEFVACSPAWNFNSLVVPSRAGETFYLLVFDDLPGEGNGGDLQLFVAEAIPAPRLTVSVDDWRRSIRRPGSRR